MWGRVPLEWSPCGRLGWNIASRWCNNQRSVEGPFGRDCDRLRQRLPSSQFVRRPFHIRPVEGIHSRLDLAMRTFHCSQFVRHTEHPSQASGIRCCRTELDHRRCTRRFP
ncbi:hypothetical protein [Rhodopirellula baltica]|uniref:hypothetical protein n=1 Tax=Rhodopirellula baltica TaxID=265606 RepID=UPI0036F40D34